MKQIKVSLFLFCVISVGLFGASVFPDELSSIPWADEQPKIVLNSFLVPIKDAQYPYNAAIVKKKNGDGYLLFFREDIPGPYLNCACGSRVGIVALDDQFQQNGPPLFPLYPRGGANSMDDPRVFWIKDDLYILHSTATGPSGWFYSHLLKINPNTLQHERLYILRHGSGRSEKNWVPLLSSEQSDQKLTFIRSIFPTDLVELNFETGNLNFIMNGGAGQGAPSVWKWGGLCGGTPAQLIDSSYLSFFHSYFGFNGRRYYVMGACTFSKDPPYRLEKISRYPILFRDIYSARQLGIVGPVFSRGWACHLEKVIFPCGFVQEGNLIHLSCGESDNSIRIVTLDKEELYRSLVPVN